MTTYTILALVCGALLLIAVAGMLLLAGLCRMAARQHAALDAAEDAARKGRES